MSSVWPLRSRSEQSAPSAAKGGGRAILRIAFGYRSYVLLLIGFFVCGFHVTFIGLHLPKYLEDVGQTSKIAALALATIGLFNIGGTMAIGWLGSRFKNTRLLALLYGIRAVAFVGMVVIPMSPEFALLSSAVIGVVWLSTVPLTSAIVLKQFGPDHAGILFGFVFLSHQIGAFIGSYGAGIYRDAYGSYSGYWWLAALLGVAGAILHLFIDEEPYQNVKNPPRPPELNTGLLARIWNRRKAVGAVTSTIGVMALLGVWSYLRIDANGELAGQQAAVICALHLPFGPLG